MVAGLQTCGKEGTLLGSIVFQIISFRLDAHLLQKQKKNAFEKKNTKQKKTKKNQKQVSSATKYKCYNLRKPETFKIHPD